MNTKLLVALPLTAVAAALGGCAGTDSNVALEQARSTVQRASSDAVAIEAAGTELDRARTALAAAESIYEEEGKSEIEQVEHQSYLAGRYAETALALADGSRAQQAIDSAEAERNRVLLDIRTAEADRNAAQAEAARLAASRNEREAELARQRAAAAEAQAVSAQAQAVSAQAEADSAQAQATALAQQLEDLEAQRTDRGIVLTLGDVLFDVDEAELKPGADSTIGQLAEFLNDYPERELTIEGHTDSTGPDSYNESLSEKRADAVGQALVQRGVPRTRFEVLGLGESQPVASNDTVAGRQQNRRVEVIVSD
jgi:outer membrane protein OmpA-like peptidoglycan-associated protein